MNEYVLVKNNHIDSFETICNRYLQGGATPLGGPSNYNGYLIQAFHVVKEEAPKRGRGRPPKVRQI